MDATGLQWQNVLAVRWRRSQHINILEAQSVLVMLKSIARDRNQWGTRVFLFVDSQVVKHVLVKGRSSSWVLNAVTRSISALSFVIGSRLLVLWTKTEFNAADGLPRLQPAALAQQWA